MNILADEAIEWNVSLMAGRLRAVAAIRARLNTISGFAASSWEETKTQGGSHTPQAEIRIELLERLQFFTSDEIRLSGLLTAADGERGRYCAGLLEGLSGEALRKATGLSHRKMEECRRWLAGIVAESLQEDIP